MMKKETKFVPADKVLRYVPSDDQRRVVMWHGVQIYIRRFISFRESVEFVNYVLDISKNGLREEMVDFAFRANVIMTYTNIELPNDLDEQYRLLYAGDLYGFILKNINEEQIASIKYAVELRINNN